MAKRPPTKNDRKQALQTAQRALHLAGQAHARSTPTPETTFQRAARYWKNAWGLVGPIVTIAVAAISFAPNLSIELGTSVSASDPFQTLLIISNDGKLPARSVTFVCDISADSVALAGPPSSVSPADEIVAGQPISRACSTSATRFEGNASLIMTATYYLPYVGLKREAIKRFDVTKGANGYALTPNSGFATDRFSHIQFGSTLNKPRVR